jgi:hypothetical protein
MMAKAAVQPAHEGDHDHDHDHRPRPPRPPRPPEHRPPHPETLDLAHALIDSQARVITNQAMLIRAYVDLVRFYDRPPTNGNGNGED